MIYNHIATWTAFVILAMFFSTVSFISQISEWNGFYFYYHALSKTVIAITSTELYELVALCVAYPFV